MQFKDAAYEILKEAGSPLHYNEITDIALSKGTLETSGKMPITLINGFQLVDLLIQYQVVVKQEQYTVPSIDAEYWSEVLGVKEVL